jgi:hypothetical protein
MPEATPTQTPEPTKTDPSELETLKAELAKTKQELDGFKQNNKTLDDKAKDELARKEKEKSDTKALETALTFNFTAKEFFKNYESLLPKGTSDILTVAEKESYDSPIQKSNSIKDAVIQRFFSQQSNMDLLTEGQKSDLAEFQKLTKNGREAQASEVYKNIFEPALESAKRVKKAEELSRSKQGFAGDTDAEQAYKNKMIEMGQKKFFGGKSQ